MLSSSVLVNEEGMAGTSNADEEKKNEPNKIYRTVYLRETLLPSTIYLFIFNINNC